jgi:hypothetical protein
LHRHLHDEGADGQHEGRRRIGPERDRRQRDQAGIAEAPGGSYGYALALFAGVVAVCIIVVIRFSPERRGQVMTVLG